MNGIRHRLLHLLRQRLLQRLGHLAVTRRVAHFAGLLVAAGIVDGLENAALVGAQNRFIRDRFASGVGRKRADARWGIAGGRRGTYVWELMLELGWGLLLDLGWDL